eukprot:scaffold107649_cov49-Prasinocladus_malaysianus.AAC.2
MHICFDGLKRWTRDVQESYPQFFHRHVTTASRSSNPAGTGPYHTRKVQSCSTGLVQVRYE